MPVIMLRLGLMAQDRPAIAAVSMIANRKRQRHALPFQIEQPPNLGHWVNAEGSKKLNVKGDLRKVCAGVFRNAVAGMEIMRGVPRRTGPYEIADRFQRARRN